MQNTTFNWTLASNTYDDAVVSILWKFKDTDQDPAIQKLLNIFKTKVFDLCEYATAKDTMSLMAPHQNELHKRERQSIMWWFLGKNGEW